MTLTFPLMIDAMQIMFDCLSDENDEVRMAAER